MTDDIVTRLRKQNKEWLSEGDLYEKNWQLWIEAADEIERLRRTMQLMQIDYTTQIAGLKMRCKCGGCND